mmetsp:Transcript_19775/g.78751  ORF Transcript_19775/g.78751 Transcript_19775/m.78751 type:complete len:294 (-) Transcript_19775:559-1440(-)
MRCGREAGSTRRRWSTRRRRDETSGESDSTLGAASRLFHRTTRRPCGTQWMPLYSRTASSGSPWSRTWSSRWSARARRKTRRSCCGFSKSVRRARVASTPRGASRVPRRWLPEVGVFCSRRRVVRQSPRKTASTRSWPRSRGARCGNWRRWATCAQPRRARRRGSSTNAATARPPWWPRRPRWLATMMTRGAPPRRTMMMMMSSRARRRSRRGLAACGSTWRPSHWMTGTSPERDRRSMRSTRWASGTACCPRCAPTPRSSRGGAVTPSLLLLLLRRIGKPLSATRARRPSSA